MSITRDEYAFLILGILIAAFGMLAGWRLINIYLHLKVRHQLQSDDVTKYESALSLAEYVITQSSDFYACLMINVLMASAIASRGSFQDKAIHSIQKVGSQFDRPVVFKRTMGALLTVMQQADVRGAEHAFTATKSLATKAILSQTFDYFYYLCRDMKVEYENLISYRPLLNSKLVKLNEDINDLANKQLNRS